MALDAVIKYRLRRDRRLRERGIRLDGRRLDDEEENENQNAGNNGGGNTGKSGGGHGNTRLPFGLCKRFGIDVDPSWQPRDAWDALAGEGITPGEAYGRLKRGEDPGARKKNTLSAFGDKYKNLNIKKSIWGGKEEYDLCGINGKGEDSRIIHFSDKDSLYYYLKDNGIEEFSDEDGKKTDISSVEMRKRAGNVSGVNYEELRIKKNGDNLALYGKDFSGRTKILQKFRTEEEMNKYLESRKIDKENVILPKSMQTSDKTPSWVKSKTKKYFEENGIKYGDITLGYSTAGAGKYGYKINATDENGNKIEKKFDTKTEAMMFLRDQGCTRIKTDKGVVDPTTVKLRDTLATVEGKKVSKLDLDFDYNGEAFLMAEDMDGRRYRIGTNTGVKLTTEGKKDWNAEKELRQAAKAIGEKYGVSEDKIGTSDNAVKRAQEAWSSELKHREHLRKMETDPEYRAQEEKRAAAAEEERRRAAEWEETHRGSHRSYWS